MTPKTMKLSEQVQDYAAELIAENFCGPREAWRLPTETADMRNGREREPEARRWFQLERDVDVQEVGLCIHENEKWAASPDGLIGDDEGLELKCPAPHTQVRWIADGVVPQEHLPQIHGALIVTGRARWWFMSYCPSLPPLLVSVEPNEYTVALRGFLEKFNDIYAEMYAKVKSRLDAHIDSEIDRRQAETPVAQRSFVSDVA